MLRSVTTHSQPQPEGAIRSLLLFIFVFVMVVDPARAMSIHKSSQAKTYAGIINRRAVLHRAGALTIGGGLLLPNSPCLATTDPLTPIVKLSDGTPFALCSFGLQIYDNDTACRLTKLALEVGYRNFFASVLAGNQRGFAKGLHESMIDRSNVFICGSVVSNRAVGFENAYEATTVGWKKNLVEFAAPGGDSPITYLDQIMLDYPGPDGASIQGQWKALEEMHAQGFVKTLAVSNFSPAQLDALLATAVIKPVVNQLPFSVAYHPGNTVEENRKRGVLVQAWAPLGKSLGDRFTSSMKGTCASIGTKYNKSYAQVSLRWILQKGAAFTTQSKSKEHFAEDLDVFDFQLTLEEMVVIDRLALNLI
jgi:diketogulonate reductase-like aldo/keto reductase